jgi:hypothetical protein
MHVEWYDRAIFQAPAVARSDDLALLWFLFGCVWDDDTAPGFFLLFGSFDEQPVVKWSDRHVFSFAGCVSAIGTPFEIGFHPN